MYDVCYRGLAVTRLTRYLTCINDGFVQPSWQSVNSSTAATYLQCVCTAWHASAMPSVGASCFLQNTQVMHLKVKVVDLYSASARNVSEALR